MMALIKHLKSCLILKYTLQIFTNNKSQIKQNISNLFWWPRYTKLTKISLICFLVLTVFSMHAKFEHHAIPERVLKIYGHTVYGGLYQIYFSGFHKQ